MNNGWIKIHRSLLNNAIARRPLYAWLWVTLLLKANHKKTEFIWNNKKMACDRGQVYTGRLDLAKECNIKPSTVENILNYLESEHQIEQQKTTKFRLITIINYSKYQQDEQQNGQQSDNRVTTNEQQSDTNKNDKNDKNNNNEKNDKSTTAEKISKILECPNAAFMEHVQSLLEKYPKKDIVAVATKCVLYKPFDKRWLKFVNMCGSEFDKPEQCVKKQKVPPVTVLPDYKPVLNQELKRKMDELIKAKEWK